MEKVSGIRSVSSQLQYKYQSLSSPKISWMDSEELINTRHEITQYVNKAHTPQMPLLESSKRMQSKEGQKAQSYHCHPDNTKSSPKKPSWAALQWLRTARPALRSVLFEQAWHWDWDDSFWNGRKYTSSKPGLLAVLSIILCPGENSTGRWGVVWNTAPIGASHHKLSVFSLITHHIQASPLMQKRFCGYSAITVKFHSFAK